METIIPTETIELEKIKRIIPNRSLPSNFEMIICPIAAMLKRVHKAIKTFFNHILILEFMNLDLKCAVTLNF